MQSRFTIVLMSIAGAAVLFGIGFALGLGVLSSPPAEQHKQSAVTTRPTVVARPETTGQATADDKKQANQPTTVGNDRALTPLYPVTPGGPAAQASNDKDQQAANPAPQPQPQQQAKAAPAEPPKAQEARTEAPAATAPKSATPVSLEHRNACDVSACARAYKSFRESDCTYQPYSGPRQVCVSPPGARDASRSHEDQRAARSGITRATDARGRASDDDDGPVLRRYHRDFTADGEDDRIVVVPADEGDAAGDDEDDQ